VGDIDAFYAGLDEKRAQVFAAHPELSDHRQEFPWLTGCIGDPFSPVWFIAENPSLTRVKLAIGTSTNLQWSVSAGDHLLRETLTEHGFKTGEPMEEGGWRCYVTDVIKSADIVKDWQGTPQAHKERVTEAWAPVMRYELEHGRPDFIVFLGKRALKLTTHLRTRDLIPNLPRHKLIHHYTYVMDRPCGKIPPADPQRVAAWKEEVGQIGREFAA
jgi:Uracil DNA glycosylase superfamily